MRNVKSFNGQVESGGNAYLACIQEVIDRNFGQFSEYPN
jgi:hypothetical protein